MKRKVVVFKPIQVGIGCPEHGLEKSRVGSTDSRESCLLGPTDVRERESQSGVL